MKFIRYVCHLADLIMKSGRYDAKKWDWGQWVCALLYGDDWMHDPEFQAIDALGLAEDSDYTPPPATAEKLARLEAWLNAACPPGAGGGDHE
jgi:hypothetical protein